MLTAAAAPVLLLLSLSLSLSLFFLPLHFTANGGGKETRNDNKTEILKMNFVEQSSGCVSASLLR